ncbi:GNAT family N-acetyltransferase [Brevibacterium sp. FAM 24630]|uniref:GNAT family N-acetyltransferase n=1 Tax=unclassified Brevibacterium TaxID=2614124 RepID=UPI003C7C51BA
MNANLRRWRDDDAAGLGRVFEQADAALLSNVPDDRSPDGARKWIEIVTGSEAEGKVCAFAVVDHADGFDLRILGNVMASGIEHRHSTAWISYWTAAEGRGRGLTSAGLRSLVDHLHDELGIYRLELGYRVNNPASAAVAMNAGFIIEGRERQKLLYDGIRYDTEVCARLADDPRTAGPRLPILPPH